MVEIALLRPLLMQPAMGDTEIDVPMNELRQLIDTIFGGSEGVIGGHSFKVVQRAAGANMSFDVNSGHAVVLGDDTAVQGAYICTSTADAYNVATFSTGGAIAAPASGTRSHRAVVQVRDKRSNPAWSSYDFDVLLIQDTGGGLPALPASALWTATISIASGQSSITTANITDSRILLPSLGYSDPWNSMSLLAGWSNRGPGYDRAAYRARYLGGGAVDVDLVGNITGGTAADNTRIFTLPAGYAPAVSQHIWVTTASRFANNDPPHIFVSNTGDMFLFNCTGANWISFNGTIRLNAPGG